VRPNTAGTLELDITALVMRNYSAFKVWTVPTELYEGLWQTPTFTVISWEFYQVISMLSV